MSISAETWGRAKGGEPMFSTVNSPTALHFRVLAHIGSGMGRDRPEHGKVFGRFEPGFGRSQSKRILTGWILKRIYRTLLLIGALSHFLRNNATSRFEKSNRGFVATNVFERNLMMLSLVRARGLKGPVSDDTGIYKIDSNTKQIEQNWS